MYRFTLRGLVAALTLLLALTAQPQKLAAEPVASLMTAEEFMRDPETYGEYDELGCMALAVYREAKRGPEAPMAEKLAIAWVIKNRYEVDFRAGNLPAADSLCEVVWADQQFSWTSLGAQAFDIEDEADFRLAFEAAKAVYTGTADALRFREELGPVDHFHTKGSSPAWASEITYVATYGAHRFYTEQQRHKAGRRDFERQLAVEYALMDALEG